MLAGAECILDRRLIQSRTRPLDAPGVGTLQSPASSNILSFGRCELCPKSGSVCREDSMFSRRNLIGSLCAGGALSLLDAEPTQFQRFRIWDAHSHLHSVPGDTPETRIEVL